LPTVAFALIGHNEAHCLPRALESIRWADEIVYVDCGSRDNSLEVARRYTQKVYSRPNNTNLNVNKQYAIDQTTADWIFYLDPDEVVTPQLARDIQEAVRGNGPANAYHLPRRNFFCGHWLRFGGKYPDTQLRLFRRGKARFPCVHVHEKLAVDGPEGRLRSPMDHYASASVATTLRKMDFYSSFNAQQMARAGKKPGFLLAVTFLLWKPGIRFIRRYIFKGGILDGWPGLVIAGIDAMELVFQLFKFWDYATHPERLPPQGVHVEGGAQ